MSKVIKCDTLIGKVGSASKNGWFVNHQKVDNLYGMIFLLAEKHPHSDDLCESQIIHYWSVTLPGIGTLSMPI